MLGIERLHLILPTGLWRQLLGLGGGVINLSGMIDE
jgi:hypothetical protein